MFEVESWPLALLALRAGTVVLLYLFLFTAFRALRADLRAPLRAPEREPEGPSYGDAYATAEAYPAALPRLPQQEWEAEWETEPTEAGTTRPSETYERRRRVPARVAIPAAAGVLVAVLGVAALVTAGDPPGDAPADTASNTQAPRNPFEPPVVEPAPGRVTVGLAATEDAQVRVTVDDVVQFEGVLQAGQKQSWEGARRIQVWTDRGKTVQLAVNGEDLGPYSPAMGHPDWNRIDYGFWPGWAQ